MHVYIKIVCIAEELFLSCKNRMKGADDGLRNEEMYEASCDTSDVQETPQNGPRSLRLVVQNPGS